MYTEAQLINFANFILTSRKGKRIKEANKTGVTLAEFENWTVKREGK